MVQQCSRVPPDHEAAALFVHFVKKNVFIKCSLVSSKDGSCSAISLTPGRFSCIRHIC